MAKKKFIVTELIELNKELTAITPVGPASRLDQLFIPAEFERQEVNDQFFVGLGLKMTIGSILATDTKGQIAVKIRNRLAQNGVIRQ